MTRVIKRCAINDLGHACSGYPHACQQKLWTSPRAAASGVARAAVPRLKQRGQSLTDQALGPGMRRLSTRLPTQSVDKPVRSRGRRPPRGEWACERHFPGRVPHLKRRGQSLTDQALGRGMRRLSTCLPTKSVDKPGGREGDDQGCRSSTVGQRANANTHNMMKFRTGTNIVRITSPNARCAERCGRTDR